MRGLQSYLSKLSCLIALGVLLTASAHGQSVNKPVALTPTTCTSRTGLHCEIYGRGDPILFLHGLGGSTYSWRYMVDPLKAHHTVILIDMRGEGASPKPKHNDYSIIHQGELIHEFIVEHDLKKLTLVGNSYGGAVSLLLAIKLCQEHPSRLAKLILIDSGGYPDHLPDFLILIRTPIIGWLVVHLLPPALQIYIVLYKSYFDPSQITCAQVAAYAGPIADRGGRNALLKIAKGAIPKDIDKYIAEYPTISVPTLILWGAEDHVLQREVGKRLHAAIPHSRLQYIQNAGHIPQEEQPDATVCRIKAFLMPGITCPPQRRASPTDRRR